MPNKPLLDTYHLDLPNPLRQNNIININNRDCHNLENLVNYNLLHKLYIIFFSSCWINFKYFVFLR